MPKLISLLVNQLNFRRNDYLQTDRSFNENHMIGQKMMEKFPAFSSQKINLAKPISSFVDRFLPKKTQILLQDNSKHADTLRFIMDQQDHLKLTVSATKALKPRYILPMTKTAGQILQEDSVQYDQLIEELITLERKKRLQLFWNKMLRPFTLLRNVLTLTPKLSNISSDKALDSDSIKLFSVSTLTLALKQYFSASAVAITPYLALGFLFKNYYETQAANFPQIDRARTELEEYIPVDATFLHKQKKFWGIGKSLKTLDDITEVENDNMLQKPLAEIKQATNSYMKYFSSDVLVYSVLWSIGVSMPLLTALKAGVTFSWAVGSAKSRFEVLAGQCIDLLKKPAYFFEGLKKVATMDNVRKIANPKNLKEIGMSFVARCQSTSKAFKSMLSLRMFVSIGATIAFAVAAGLTCQMIMPPLVSASGLVAATIVAMSAGAYLGSRLAGFAINKFDVRCKHKPVENVCETNRILSFSPDAWSQSDFDMIEKFCHDSPALGVKLVGYFIDRSAKLEDQFKRLRPTNLAATQKLEAELQIFENNWGQLLEAIQTYSQDNTTQNHQSLLRRIELITESFAALEIKSFEKLASRRDPMMFSAAGRYSKLIEERAPLESLQAIKAHISVNNVISKVGLSI